MFVCIARPVWKFLIGNSSRDSAAFSSRGEDGDLYLLNCLNCTMANLGWLTHSALGMLSLPLQHPIPSSPSHSCLLWCLGILAMESWWLWLLSGWWWGKAGFCPRRVTTRWSGRSCWALHFKQRVAPGFTHILFPLGWQCPLRLLWNFWSTWTGWEAWRAHTHWVV